MMNNENPTKNHSENRRENRIEKWQWGLLAAWLLFIVPVGGEYFVQVSTGHASNPDDRPVIRPLEGGETIDLGTIPLDGYLDDYKPGASQE